MNQKINTAFMKLSRRAEGVERTTLVETFVDIGPLFTLLSSRDHQIVYGRRGTGKTHAFAYLEGSVLRSDDVAVHIDMRRVGSTGGIYADPQVDLSERATRLLMDTVGALHEGLLDHFVLRAESNLARIGPLLDALATAATEVVVSGPTEVQAKRRSKSEDTVVGEGIVAVSLEPSLQLQFTSSKSREAGSDEAVKQSGVLQHRVHFGRLSQALENLLVAMDGRRIWLLLDEWSAVPADLQPYLADLLRRSFFPLRGCTVKIAAIEQRSHFRIAGERGDYIGIEVGADAAANVNLDDFMVFENDPDLATRFFEELLFKHFESVRPGDLEIGPAARLVAAAFTQRNTFEEFVRSAEGVPRDAINVLSLAAQRAFESPIAIEHIRSAARSWYQRDKEAAVGANTQAQSLLHWIIDEVIAHRRARAFLLRADSHHDLIDALFDSRVLHLVKRSISTHDQPGVRYDAYKIDYGCYVDLLTTARAPIGLLPADAETFIEVPPDDYRAIRRAILDLAVFESHRTEEEEGG